MTNYPKEGRWRLCVDLTRYHPAFCAGVIGVIYSRSYQLDQFVMMRLDSGAELEVLWKSIEQIG